MPTPYRRNGKCLNYEELHGEMTNALSLKKVAIPRANSGVFCDMSSGSIRPFVTKTFRRVVFNTVHRLAHPGISATVKLMTERYVWPSIKFDCRRWAWACVPCQRSKISRHVHSPLGKFALSERFEHVI